MTEKRVQHDDEIRGEYDFSGGVRGKYAKRFSKGSNVVVLAPDVAEEFRTAKAVNDALRSYLEKKPTRKAPRRLTGR
ncbi:MAG: hypothetical protein ACRDIC_10625 [bacterium]